MSIEANKALARRLIVAVCSGDETTVNDLLAPDCVLHSIGGPSDLLDIFRSFRTAFPDLSGMVTSRSPRVTRS